MNAAKQKKQSKAQKIELFDADKYFAEETQQGKVWMSNKQYNSAGIAIAKINTSESSNYRKSQTKGFR